MGARTGAKARNRQRIATSQSDKCHYCGVEFSKTNKPTIDHVLPKHLGGKNDSSNKVAACAPCNNFKGGLNPTDWEIINILRPRKPGNTRDPVNIQWVWDNILGLRALNAEEHQCLQLLHRPLKQLDYHATKRRKMLKWAWKELL